ncbi:MAG TPA: MBL fold metallo-hydrolase [Acidimicrobiales bacterium]|nr:MBL fold metallo-hydrolase [Acidimicrobiales bacterium]
MGAFARGRVDVGGGCHAWLQPDGSWGWSNAGLVVGEGASLLVDTLFDLRLTREMLDGFAPLTAPNPIGTLVNTHANGDHCYGNELVAGAEIVATEACAEEMGHTPPELLASMVEAGERGDLGDTGRYLARIFGPFEFRGITLTPPTSTFTGRRTIDVAGTAVELVEVGPAHTAGDCIAHVPSASTVFTGDICFIEGTPIMWAGPISRWIAACDLIADELQPEVVVPGHGPVTDAGGVRRMREYLVFVDEQARARHAAGMALDEAVHDIALGEFAGWVDRERIAVNVDSVYRELEPGRPSTDVTTLFGLMADLAV